MRTLEFDVTCCLSNENACFLEFGKIDHFDGIYSINNSCEHFSIAKSQL